MTPHYTRPEASVLQWLLDSDPAIRWQVLQNLVEAPSGEDSAERARVATQGLGAQLLLLQEPDGTWGGAAWNRGWNSTMHVLMLLHDFGLDPASEQARRALSLVRDHVTWQGWDAYDGNRFFAGEVEPCINGQVAAVGAYFGEDVCGIIDRLLTEQLSDGGWNCEAQNGSTRSSFHTTICVLEALLEYERRFGGQPGVAAARLRGEDYLLERHLFHRLSTSAVIPVDRKTGTGSDSGQPAFTRFAFPGWWHYDVLRGLEYFRRADRAYDDRLAEALALVESKRRSDGRWSLHVQYPGTMPVELDAGEGLPSRWVTLRALCVLKRYAP
jgi:hypothetical protein